MSEAPSQELVVVMDVAEGASDGRRSRSVGWLIGGDEADVDADAELDV